MHRYALVVPLFLLSHPFADAEDFSVAEVARRSRDSVVVVTTENRDGEEAGLGTGFVISTDGLVATSLHVIGEARPIWVQPRGGERIPVREVYASDRTLDLALLRVAKSDLRPLPLADVDSDLAKGQTMVAIGHPLGLKDSVVSGVLSGERVFEGVPMWQTAMTIEPGNSGGPLLDLRGHVHGVIAMKSTRKPFGFAVQVDQLRKLLEQPNPIVMDQWKTIGQIDVSRWSPLMGARWRQRGGRTLVEGAGKGFGGRGLLLRREARPNVPFELAVSVKLDDESGAAGLVFHADGADRHYGFYPSAGRLRLTSFEGPTVYSWNIIREVETEHYTRGAWNELKVRVEQDRIVGFVNGQEVLSVDEVRQQPGLVGLAKFRDTKAEFKQFRFGKVVPSNTVSAEQYAALSAEMNALPPRAEAGDDQLSTQTLNIRQRMTVLERQARELELQAGQRRALAQDLHTAFVVDQLKQLTSKERDVDFDLLRGALLIAMLDNAELDLNACIERVHDMAATIRQGLDPDNGEAERIKALDDYLFNQQGFHGSRTNYYHAANSHLDRVLDDREGLPITLSVLYMSLAEQLELRVVGLGLPGHFVVRHEPSETEPEIIDVFDRGKRLTTRDARMLILQGRGVPVEVDSFPPSTHRSILIRMLTNLLGVAQAEDDPAAMLRYLEGIVCMDPDNASMRGLRGVLRHRQGRQRAALEDIDWILAKQPAGVDLQQVHRMRELFAR